MCHLHRKTVPAQSVTKHTVSALAPAAYSKTSKHNGGQRDSKLWMQDGGSQPCPYSPVSLAGGPFGWGNTT